MARDRGLLERLRRGEPAGARSVQQSSEELYTSIHDHLIRLLNTRQDDSAAFPDYGLPSLCDVDKGGRAIELRQSIERTIRRYEPRLTSVRVEYVEKDPLDPLRIRFRISGKPAGVRDGSTFRFDTSVDTTGSWKVSD
ncbi:MAG: type VI secretion system baseplate subunit TssE [Myxococcota bacterium]